MDNIQNTCTCLFINRLCMFMSGQFGLCLFMVVYDCLFVACSSVLTKQTSPKTVFLAISVPGKCPPFFGPKKCISARFCHLRFCLEKNRHPRINILWFVVYVGLFLFTSVHGYLCLFMSAYVFFMSAYVCICLFMSVYVC